MKIASALLLFCIGISAPDLLGATHYVDANSATPGSPYTSWATAASNIQDAIDVSSAADEVVVTNGVYATGGRAVYGTMTNRVVVDKALFVHSVNGPQFTVIKGYQVPGSTNGDGAIRCVYLTNGALLDGFTLTNGATLVGSFAPPAPLGGGGGVWCESNDALVTNCWLLGNAAWSGGGAYNGTLVNCELRANIATGSQGTYYGGGGSAWATLRKCKLFYNTASSIGGGALVCSLSDCLVCSNSASCANGGGVYGGTLNNCTVVGNVGVGAFGYYSGHSGELCTLNNCIVYFNDENWYTYTPLYSFSNCCTTPDPGGGGNIISDPLFVDLASGNLRLQSNSPCINAGNNFYVSTSTDLDSNPRIINGTVDMGSYEFQGSSGFTGFHAWLAQYGLASDGSVDYADSDGDGMNNWQEWRTGTNPTNAASVFRLLSVMPSTTNVVLSWQSTLGVGYFVQSSSNLNSPTPFTTVASNLAGQNGSTVFVDTNGPGTAQRFYRVGAQ